MAEMINVHIDTGNAECPGQTECKPVTLQEMLISPSPRVVAEIGDVKVGCILDTGAEASLIPVQVYHSRLESLGPIGKLESSVRIVGVEGRGIPVEGYVKATVKVNNHRAMVGFLVVDQEIIPGTRQEDYPVLLGCNALRAIMCQETNKDDFDITAQSMKMSQETSELSQIKRNVTTGAALEVIPPKSVRPLRCSFDADVQDKSEGVWLVESSRRHDSSVQIVEGCVSEHQVLRILVINNEDHEVVLQPHTTLTTAVKLETHGEIMTRLNEETIEVNVSEVFVENIHTNIDCNRAKVSTMNDACPANEDNGQNTKAYTDKFTLVDGTTVDLPHGICLDSLNPEEASLVAEMLYNNRDAFSSDDLDLGFCDMIPHEIKLTNEKNIRLPYRRIHPHQMEEVKSLLQDLLDREIIRPSTSPYASPVVLVRKKTGALRLCIDYRQLNTITIRDSFPLPKIEDSLEAMSGAKYFTSLDLSHGYFQLAMHENSIPFTAFRVPWGLYEFLRLPQGLCNSPGTFQRVMEQIFGDMNLQQLILYLDDVLVFSKTLEEHITTLNEVFRRLAEHGLKLKGKKCKLLQSKVEHLGHIVSAEGIAVNPDKIARIDDWPTPKSASEVSSFLGLASYYRRFVPGFAEIAAPLHQLVGKRSPRRKRKKRQGTDTSMKSEEDTFQWTDEANSSFRTLKELLSSPPVLIYPQFDKEFFVEVDASLKGLGACLLQADEEGKLHPVAYASRGLRGAERRYPDFSSFKIELLAMKWAVTEKFKGYLQYSRCTVLTDNNPLVHLQTAQLGATEQRWVAQLAPFNIRIQYKPGRLNTCADALSRCPANDIEDVKASIGAVTNCSVLPTEMQKDEPPDLTPTEPPTNSSSVFPSYTHAQLANMQREDEHLGLVWKCWETGWKPGDEVPSSSSELKGWLKQYDKLSVHHGVLYRQISDAATGSFRQLLVPRCLRSKMLEHAHDDWGHQGVNRTVGILKTRCFWPALQQDVKTYVKKCFSCAITKTPVPTIRTPMRHLLAFQPMELLAIDFLKLDRGKGGYEDVLVMTDAFTKFAQAVPCRNQTAPVVARVLHDTWFVHYGVPLRIHSDQGKNFESSVIRELCHLYNIEKTRTTPYHPEGNGQTERFNRTLCTMIRSLSPTDRRKWPELISDIVFLYNSTPHRVTGMSPYRLLFGREPYTPLDQLLANADLSWDEDFVEKQARALQCARECARKHITQVHQSEKKRKDSKPMSESLPVGSRVLLKRCAFDGRHKLEDRFHRSSFIVTDVNAHGDVYAIRPLLGGPIKWVNRRLLINDPRDELLQIENDGSFPGQDERSSEAFVEGESDILDPDEDSWYWIAHSRRNPQALSVRRSDRTSKGLHSNPYHLPRPANSSQR